MTGKVTFTLLFTDSMRLQSTAHGSQFGLLQRATGHTTAEHWSVHPGPHGPGLQVTLHGLPPHWVRHRALPGLQIGWQNVLGHSGSHTHTPPQQSQPPNGLQEQQ